MIRVCVLLVLICVTQAAPSNLHQALVQADQAAQASSAAIRMRASLDQLKEMEKVIQSTSEALSAGTYMISEGLCHFLGFCENNPATDCQQVHDQAGIENATLPDGKYWLRADPKLGYNGPAERIDCLFDESGTGWALLFDDSASATVSQKVKSPLMQRFKIKEVLAYTPEMIEKALAPVRQPLYYVDDAHIATTAGKTYSEMHAYQWVGQDAWAKQNDQGKNFPKKQKHFQYKYFGKIQVVSGYRGTLYIMDDGNVQDDSCETMLSPTRCGEDFFCTITDSVSTPSGFVAQTSFPVTPLGVISLGCSGFETNFTQCGSCNYDGPANNLERAQIIRSSIIQKMYAK
eukprot:c15955_g1_i1.p1 GENE.c15955_g1_i1~~c15955_g1_i1.p1  ORF type:complete len:359 (+),score=148.21 c15955_g1_i1:42-1079(+)